MKEMIEEALAETEVQTIHEILNDHLVIVSDKKAIDQKALRDIAQDISNQLTGQV